MVVDKNHMTGLWLGAQHNGMIWRMWVAEGKDMPWALALRVSPAVATQAGSRCPDWVDEYDLASALLDDAIDMVPCETNDLLVPADREIVIEGVVSRNEVETEGPFGEYPGYLPGPGPVDRCGPAGTTNIRLGPLGHLLPYHHPVELAHRVAYLDHMARGRYQLGVATSALPRDHQLPDLDTAGGRNRQTFEALDIMTRLWNDGPHEFEGEFWSVGQRHSTLDGLGYRLRPFQTPHPPVAIAGMTPGSANHQLAGERATSQSVSGSARITRSRRATGMRCGRVPHGAGGCRTVRAGA